MNEKKPVLSPSEKYQYSLKLRNALTAKKEAEETVKEISPILIDYVKSTGDKKFNWKSGLSLTYVSESTPKPTTDAKTALGLIQAILTTKGILTQADFDACVAQATTLSNPRKPYFR